MRLNVSLQENGSTFTNVSFQENDDTFPNVMRDVQVESEIPIGYYAPLHSPAFTGIPTAPTAPAGTISSQIATTEFVREEIVSSQMGYGNIVLLNVSEVTS